MTESAFMYKPITDDEADKKAAARALIIHLTWVFDLLVHGDYSIELQHYLEKSLPRFRSEEKLLIKNSTDFIGLDHYSTLLVKDCLYSNCTCMHDNNPTCTHGENRAISQYTLLPSRWIMVKVITTHSNFIGVLLPLNLIFSIFFSPFFADVTSLLYKMGPTSKVSRQLKRLTKSATSAKKVDKNILKFSLGQ